MNDEEWDRYCENILSKYPSNWIVKEQSRRWLYLVWPGYVARYWRDCINDEFIVCDENHRALHIYEWDFLNEIRHKYGNTQ